MSRELLAMALDALDHLGNSADRDVTPECWQASGAEAVCFALRSALAQPEAEPVAWTWDTDGTGGEMKGCYEAHFQFKKPYPDKRILNLTPLFAAPQAQPAPAVPAVQVVLRQPNLFASAPAVPVPLTDDQIDEIWDGSFDSADPKRQLSFRQIITRAIEAHHGIGGGK